MIKGLLFFVVAILVYQFFLSPQTISLGPGIYAPTPPEQIAIQSNTPIYHKDHAIFPLAEFSLKAKVLSKKRYLWDSQSHISPYDLALGWGSMSDETVLSSFRISQSNRWYFWKTEDKPPISHAQVISQSSNMHLIPQTPDIEKSIQQSYIGEIIKMKGYLVRVESRNGGQWQSSLSRTDTGNGACEVVYVTEFHSVVF